MAIIPTSDNRYELNTDTQAITPNPDLPRYITNSMPSLTYTYTTGEVTIDTIPCGDHQIAQAEIEAAHHLFEEIRDTFNHYPRALHPGHTTTPLTFGNKTFDELPTTLWHPADGWCEGAILVSTWGYDQTNAAFWQVLRIGLKTVVVRKIGATIDYIDSMTFYVTPIQHRFLGVDNPRIRRTIRTDEHGENRHIKTDDFALAYLWDGEPMRCSGYC